MTALVLTLVHFKDLLKSLCVNIVAEVKFDFLLRKVDQFPWPLDAKTGREGRGWGANGSTRRPGSWIATYFRHVGSGPEAAVRYERIGEDCRANLAGKQVSSARTTLLEGLSLMVLLSGTDSRSVYSDHILHVL